MASLTGPLQLTQVLSKSMLHRLNPGSSGMVHGHWGLQYTCRNSQIAKFQLVSLTVSLHWKNQNNENDLRLGNVCAQSLSCVWLCDPVDCSLPGSSVHRIFQAIILEWLATSISRGLYRPRDRTHVSCIFCIGRGILCHWATWEALDWGIVPYSFDLVSNKH